MHTCVSFCIDAICVYICMHVATVCIWCHVDKTIMKQSEHAHRNQEIRLYIKMQAHLRMYRVHQISSLGWVRRK